MLDENTFFRIGNAGNPLAVSFIQRTMPIRHVAAGLGPADGKGPLIGRSKAVPYARKTTGIRTAKKNGIRLFTPNMIEMLFFLMGDEFEQ